MVEHISAKEYLSQAWQIKMRIENMTEIAAFMRSAAECPLTNLNDMPKPPRNIHKNEDIIINILEYEERIKSEQKKLDGVMQTIAEINDPTSQAVIVKRYMERKTWTEIAAEIYASERHTRRVHEAVLAEIEQFLKSDRLCP